MPKTKKVWRYVAPQKNLSYTISDSEKREVEQGANELIESFLKPTFIQSQPAGFYLNYVVDISSKWYRNYFYFCSRYCCPGPNAVSPYFDRRFARMECVDRDSLHLAYMRYTGQWNVIFFGLTLDECLRLIGVEPHFKP